MAALLFATTFACGSAPPPESAVRAKDASRTGGASTATATATAMGTAEKQLTADETLSTDDGATFQAARGWFVSKRGAMTVLQTPEKEVSIALVTSTEPDAEKAITAAWENLSKGFSRPVKQRMTPPARDGWTSITQIVYETKTDETRVVIGLARAEGGKQHVMLFDGTESGFDRRGAQIGTIQSSYKPKGLAAEALGGREAHDLDSARLAAFASFAESARDALTIPGTAVAIVQHGKVVFAKGFGVREKGKPELVTPKTLFMIGSTTKSLTTIMMAKLVDEGVFDWDTPMTKLMPEFALGDASATEKITLRHTVCACTGMPRQDMAFLFEYAGSTPEKRVASLRQAKPTTGFGETFQYSNMLVAAGGYVAAHAAAPGKALGPAYDETLRSRVLEPLGMRSTTSDLATVRRAEHASPHGLTPEGGSALSPLGTEEGVFAIRPAGAVWSNVEEMARVLALELGKGSVDGKHIVSEKNLLLRREPQVKITEKMAYGIGLFLEDDHGLPVAGHGGNNLGFTSDFFFLPKSDVGMVVLSNKGGANTYRRVLRRKLVELLFDANPEAEPLLRFALEQGKKSLAGDLALVERRPSAAFFTSLAGTWSSPELGTITIRRDAKGTAILDAGEWNTAFGEKTEKDGGKKLYMLDPPWLGETLVVGSSGEPTLTLESGQEKHVFRRTK
ncbi:Beta-lactamase [Labilithrix luteola]|uniref:Beta-lactamase n=1 Tax=Labilithrix luteola TaxID=1391654 RepID=A0A0K1PP49_9BACT|nr:Beta-lactamase [Labilithrix luteola]